MGGMCSKDADGQVKEKADSEEGSLKYMFNRFDEEKKGYISLKNLRNMMKDDKTYFQGRDASHIMEKFGSDGKMTYEQFQKWWTSTYTTYNDDSNLQRMVEEVTEEQNKQLLESISENHQLPAKSVAVSRS